jgi:hypothetical protein
MDVADILVSDDSDEVYIVGQAIATGQTMLVVYDSDKFDDDGSSLFVKLSEEDSDFAVTKWFDVLETNDFLLLFGAVAINTLEGVPSMTAMLKKGDPDSQDFERVYQLSDSV